MNTREIEILIGRYFEAETTLEEEQLLKQFFSGDNVPDELKHHAALFRFASNEEKLQAPSLTDEQLSGSIQDKKRNLFAIPRTYLTMAGIAASLLLFVALWHTFNGAENVKTAPAYSQSEIDEALQVTQKTLAFASEILNHGTAPLENLNRLNAAAPFAEGLQKLETGINEMNRGLRHIEEGAAHINRLSTFNLLTNPHLK
jgi:hypothetical protein